MSIERWSRLRYGAKPHIYPAGSGQWWCIGRGASDYGWSPQQAWALWARRSEAIKVVTT